MNLRSVIFLTAIGCLGTAAHLTAQCPQTEVPVWGGARPDAQYGTSVDLRGDIAVVGAPGWAFTVGSSAEGLVNVARWDGTQWASSPLVKTASMGVGSQFGTSVALSESADVLVVGAPGVDDVGIDRGRIAIYEWDVGLGSYQPRYEAVGYHDHGRMGTSVDVSGDRVVAGEPGAFSEGGAVHIYERTAPGLWIDKGAFTFGGTSRFGHSVAASGQRFVTGGPRYDLGSWANAGAVKGFEWDGTQWLSILDIVGDYDEGRFGFSIDLWGDHMAVGFPYRATHSGGGRVYSWDGSTYVLKHSSASLAVNSLTGYDVAVSEQRAAFGSPGYDDGVLGVIGGCRLLLNPAGVKSYWAQVRYGEFPCGLPEAWSYYGAAVAMDGKRMIVGAPYAYPGGVPLGGQAFVSDLADSVGFADRGHALAGYDGVEPQLLGYSDPCMEPDLYPVVVGARPVAPAHVVVGFSEVLLPFKGGVMVPDFDLLVGPLLTDAFGQLRLNATLPLGLPPYSFWLQVWITDVDGPVGFAASNGLRLDVPAY
ncbi:MAG: hypothetical protein ACYTG2_09135 [Planctomycetota bacterium]|jgi:hypothetical protein